MKANGEVYARCNCSDIVLQFSKSEKLQKCILGCTLVETLGDGLFVATIKRLDDHKIKVKQIIKVELGSDDSHFVVGTKGTDPENLVTSTLSDVWLQEQNGGTLLKYSSKIVISSKGEELEQHHKGLVLMLKRVFELAAQNAENWSDSDKASMSK